VLLPLNDRPSGPARVGERARQWTAGCVDDGACRSFFASRGPPTNSLSPTLPANREPPFWAARNSPKGRIYSISRLAIALRILPRACS
jgi:hypothetical protein